MVHDKVVRHHLPPLLTQVSEHNVDVGGERKGRMVQICPNPVLEGPDQGPDMASTQLVCGPPGLVLGPPGLNLDLQQRPDILHPIDRTS